jgi:hypothetical protein
VAILLSDDDHIAAVRTMPQDRRVTEIHVGAEIVGTGLGLVLLWHVGPIDAGTIANVGVAGHHLVRPEPPARVDRESNH